jgi:hypothetical protein
MCAILKGIVVKYNTNQRYATTCVTATLFRELGKLVGSETQVCNRSWKSYSRNRESDQVIEWKYSYALHNACLLLFPHMVIQEFCSRSDMGCGSTIGPILSTLTGKTRANSQWIPTFALRGTNRGRGNSSVFHAQYPRMHGYVKLIVHSSTCSYSNYRGAGRVHRISSYAVRIH